MLDEYGYYIIKKREYNNILDSNTIKRLDIYNIINSIFIMMQEITASNLSSHKKKECIKELVIKSLSEFNFNYDSDKYSIKIYHEGILLCNIAVIKTIRFNTIDNLVLDALNGIPGMIIYMGDYSNKHVAASICKRYDGHRKVIKAINNKMLCLFTIGKEKHTTKIYKKKYMKNIDNFNEKYLNL